MYQEFLDVALKCAENIAEIYTEGFYETNNIEWKDEKDPVTEYDKNIEKQCREFINSHFPDHAILGEEDGLDIEDADYNWIIDPIDGTINYIRGIAFSAFSLALSYKGELIVGVVSNPITKETFYASKGGGAFLNGQKITVSEQEEAKRCYMAMGKYRPQYANYYHQFIEAFQSVRNPGSAALSLAYLAAGRIDILLYFKLSAWDVAAGVIIVQEAGGLVHNINSDTYSIEKASIIASNHNAYPVLKEILSDLKEFS